MNDQPSALLLAAEQACAAIERLNPDATESGYAVWDPDGRDLDAPDEVRALFAAGDALMREIDRDEQRAREHLAAVEAERDRLRVEVERLRAIEQRAREYVDDTTLVHPSASETVLHTAMREVLEGPDAADAAPAAGR